MEKRIRHELRKTKAGTAREEPQGVGVAALVDFFFIKLLG
jgi:hypothetical protein